MKVSIADEAARRETQIFQKNSVHVMKYTPSNRHVNESKRKSTKHSSSGRQQTFSKLTEVKKSNSTCFSCGGIGHMRKDCRFRKII